jgi:predicted methyltransferase
MVWSVRVRWICSALMVSTLAGCAAPEPTALPERQYFWIVHNRDRSDADRARDQDFQPDTLLLFQGVLPDTRIADIGAGDGYFTELLARVAGPRGRIYAQNPARHPDSRILRRFADRMKKPVMSSVTPVARAFDDPLPAEARNLDLVVANYSYHVAVALGADRMRMNRAVFDALKPGGFYVVTDYSARKGRGFSDAAPLARVEEVALSLEVEAAGFKLVEKAGFLQSRDDPLSVSARDSGIRADAYSLKFVKPK